LFFSGVLDRFLSPLTFVVWLDLWEFNTTFNDGLIYGSLTPLLMMA
jgi:hypothetical protein